MSYNYNFNNNFHGGNFTFRVPDFPPPPLPPPYFPRPQFHPSQPLYPQTSPQNNQTQEEIDQDFVKKFGSNVSNEVKKVKPIVTTIIQLKAEMQDLVRALRNIETEVNDLKENIDKLSEVEWKERINKTEDIKKDITEKLQKCTGEFLDMSRKVLTKRTAKRLRLKRQKEERKLAKKERAKQLEERSRKIDENLQKIKDSILKAQQEEQSKLEADVVLREVLRKKQDAKKCLVKLDALLKLRKARQNTAKGRGENVSERDASAFLYDIEKMKALWKQKLLLYDKEEAELKAKLAEGTTEVSTSIRDTEKEVLDNLGKWRSLLFGNDTASPQENFHGDINKFMSVRFQWDQYISSEGSPLPVGWVVPPLEP